MRKGLSRLLNWILEFEEWLFGEPIPNNWVMVDYTAIAEALIQAFPMAQKIYLVDRYYYLCPKQDIEALLAEDPTDQETYVSEFHDCDDFSFRLMGQFHKKPYSALAFGIAWSQTHAYNACIVTEDQKVWIIEPQTDQLLDPKQADPNYETQIIFM